jgi:hypothetical protein
VSDPKSDPAPEWAKRVANHLAVASHEGDGNLTDNEEHLINIASLLLRSRFGDTVLRPDDARQVIIATLRGVLRDLEQAQP